MSEVVTQGASLPPEGIVTREATPTPQKYNAFISYAHAADGALAPALRNGLHRFATPWRVFRLANPTRSLRVFQVQASTSNNPKLWPTIEAALGGSEWFILLASPVAAASPWVGNEVAFWCANKSIEQFLIVLTDGDLAWDTASGDFDWGRTNALPQNLKGLFSSEPRWSDARWARSPQDASLKNGRFLELIADLAATLRGVPKDELIGEDIKQAKRLALWRKVAFGTLSLLLAAVSVAAIVAWQQMRQAERQTGRLLAKQAQGLLAQPITQETSPLIAAFGAVGWRLEGSKRCLERHATRSLGRSHRPHPLRPPSQDGRIQPRRQVPCRCKAIPA
jgi:hypothetical protein